MNQPTKRTGPQLQLGAGGKAEIIHPEDTAPEREFQCGDFRNPPILESDGPITLSSLRKGGQT
jgi:hypothetical protein